MRRHVEVIKLQPAKRHYSRNEPFIGVDGTRFCTLLSNKIDS